MTVALKWFGLAATIVLLSGCRYWSLYKFGDQFCSYDEHIEITRQVSGLAVDFMDPVLPQRVLSRYLKAVPIVASHHPYSLLEHYEILRLDEPHQSALRFHLDYALGSGKPLLQRGQIDASLSQLFPVEFVDAVLRSACTDDFDLSLKQIDIRFELPEIPAESYPKQQDFISVFGPNTIVKNRLSYQFDFIYQDHAGKSVLQNKPIYFELDFSANKRLSKMHIHYLKYDYWLDFERQTGRLLAIRT